MKATASLPEAKKLFQLSKLYGIPINDDRLLSLTDAQAELIYYMIVEDNPKLEDTTVYDEEFDRVQAEEEKEALKTGDWEDI